MAEKMVNYTPEQTVQMVQAYTSGVTVESLAETMGKTVRSVVAKLSREGVYISKAKTAGAKRVTKEDLVASMAAMLNLDPKVLASFEKASKEALENWAD